MKNPGTTEDSGSVFHKCQHSEVESVVGLSQFHGNSGSVKTYFPRDRQLRTFDHLT